MTKSAVIVNPSKVADLDGHRREIYDALAAAGWPEPLWLPTTPDDPGRGMARAAAAAGAEVVLVCGGDGTVMAAAGELAGTDVAVALVPSGTGNLLAANLGIPRSVSGAVATAVSGARRRIDVGEVEGAGVFTVMAGMGFDAAMVGEAQDEAKRRYGVAAYVASGLRNLTRRRISVRIRLHTADGPETADSANGMPGGAGADHAANHAGADQVSGPTGADGATDHATGRAETGRTTGPAGKPRWLRREAQAVLVANVGRLRGGIPLLPDAEPDDGLLDVAILTPSHLSDWVRLAGGVMLHRGGAAHGLETFRVRAVEIVADREEPCEIDGDVVAPARRLAARVRPGALIVCVPQA
ncbi:diacylglycerol/lipid kinase family protein [Dactylosporangium darangshiense]|uniref:DAGKc domain-containing protein n=1 Tax=Dactylosporangium darangshiense TaxID=579108 RepID=A0ABP8D5R2_9ACTN